MTLEYSQILSRFSVRRYDQAHIDPARLDDLMKNIPAVVGLDNSADFMCEVFEYNTHLKTAGALGPYGRIFKAPYFIAPFMLGTPSNILDLGFRAQQIVLNMWADGIGTCYIGCAHQQRRVLDLLNLPKQARIISLVAFGIPSENQSQYVYQKLSRAFTNSSRRLDYEELFIADSFPVLLDQPHNVRKVIEAGRMAPSATNAQPWRFEISGEYFVVYTKMNMMGKIYDLGQDYSLHDTGICMANMSEAARSIGKSIQWELTLSSERIPEDHLVPAARFKIESLKG